MRWVRMSLELKVDQNAETAITQIKNMRMGCVVTKVSLRENLQQYISVEIKTLL